MRSVRVHPVWLVECEGGTWDLYVQNARGGGLRLWLRGLRVWR